LEKVRQNILLEKVRQNILLEKVRQNILLEKVQQNITFINADLYYMIKISFIILFIILIGIILITNKETSICDKQLTDNEYINHMITHHEVAVYMSETHLHNTKNSIIMDILRNVIRLQKYEINLMKDSKIVDNINDNLNDDMSNTTIQMDNSYRYIQGDFTKPNTPHLSDTFCDPSFFNMSHNKNLHHMTDAMYIQHMIPHHQVAVDMSKKILKTSKNDFIIDLAYKIIHNQQLEITKLYYLSKSKYMFESNIL
jgi:uncharacterized protein (DUF305 family)